MRLTYTVETFEEIAIGEQITSKRSRQRVQSSTIGQVGTGMIQVRVSVDNVDVAVGSFDQTGHLRNVSVLLQGPDALIKMTSEMVVRMWQHPLVAQLESETLRINERFAGEVLLSDLLAPTLTAVSTPEPKTRLAVTYTGQKRVGGVVAVELQSALTTSPKTTYRVSMPGVPPGMEVDSMNIESKDWLEPIRGYRIQSYEILTMSVVAAGRRLFMRQITTTTLDRTASRGL